MSASPRSNPPSRRRLVLWLFVILTALLALGEGASRAWLTSPSAQDFDPELGWTWHPGAVVFNAKEGGARLHLNAQGLNDAPIRPVVHGPRIAVLGNSFTEALQVPRADNFTSLLERETGADVLNLGRSAMHPAHYPIVLKRFLWTHPTRALVVVGEGDLVNLLSGRVRVTRDSAGQIVAITPVLEGKDRLKELFGPILRRSALATRMMRRLKPIIMGWRQKWTGQAEDAAPEADLPEAGQEAAQRLAFILRELDAMVPVVVVDIPHLIYKVNRQVSPGSERERQAYARAAQLAGVPYVDTFEALRADFAQSGQPAFGFPNLTVGHGHLNRRGHQAVAAALAQWLARHPIPAAKQRAASAAPSRAASPFIYFQF